MNLGKGGSIKKAISISKTEYLIIFDPDLEYDEKELDYLINEIQSKKVDFLLGNRIHKSEKFIYKKLLRCNLSYKTNKFALWHSNNRFGNSHQNIRT